jgi:hypothetical protein
MIAVAAGHSETALIDRDLEAEFFYAVKANHQTFGDTYHPEKGRSLQIPNFDFANYSPPTNFVPPTFPPAFFIPNIPTATFLSCKSSRARRFDII